MFERITISPEVHFGKPCVAGTRITVEQVLELIQDGISFAGILSDYYPALTRQDLYACMQYAIALVAAEDIDLTPAVI